jgi:hypothetical protein
VCWGLLVLFDNTSSVRCSNYTLLFTLNITVTFLRELKIMAKYIHWNIKLQFTLKRLPCRRDTHNFNFSE